MFGFVEGGHNTQGEVERAPTEIAHEVEWRGRRLAAAANGIGRADERDVIDVVTRRMRQGTGLPPARDPAEHQPWVACPNRLRTQSQPLHDPRAKTFNNAVSLLQQTHHRLDSFGLFEIDGNGAAAAVHDRIARGDRQSEPGGLGAVDAQDVCAHIG